MPPAARTGESDNGLVLAADETTHLRRQGQPPPAVPPADREFPIDLSSALRLAEVENPLIAESRQRIREALAVQQGARVLLLPTLNAGTNYHLHTGNLQRSSGRILNLNGEQSLYVGGGARTLAAESLSVPAVNIFSELTNAIFEPLAARQQVEGARFNASATANTILLEVAELHIELIAAEAMLNARRESALQAAEIARITRNYAEAKEGRSADAERASTELTLLEREIQEAEELVAVTSARLGRRLHLDQTVRIRPVSPSLELVSLIDPGASLTGLIQAALRRRPELGARSAAVAVAETRHREERYRPLLPTVWVGFSGGAFGGGSLLVPPTLGNFRGRTDFDVRVFWTLQNFGVGNLARQKGRWAEVGQAVGERSRAIAEIRGEVGAAHAQVNATRRQVDLTLAQLRSAEQGFQQDLVRIRNTVGRPVEAVNSLVLLNRARHDRIRAVSEYNKAQFRLFVALGSPPPLTRSIAGGPRPRAPIAPPPIPPLASGPPPTVERASWSLAR
ncbi:MAG: hypothetical protein NVSMB9_21570 [Isosphaeraceae bacterium]